MNWIGLFIASLFFAQTRAADAQCPFVSAAPGKLYLIGVEFGIGALNPDAFIANPSYPCCDFDFGDELVYSAAAAGSIPISQTVDVRASLGIRSCTGRFTEYIDNMPVRDNNGEIQYVRFKESLDVTITAFSLELMGSLRLFNDRLVLSAGPSITYTTSEHETQSETIIGPAEIVFLDGNRTRRIVDRDLGLRAVQSAWFNLRAGTRIKVFGQIVVPELCYMTSFSSLTEQRQGKEQWNAQGLALALGVYLGLP